ncbi:WD repeat domain-containing protein 83, partial [Fragariocoptes setiger]
MNLLNSTVGEEYILTCGSDRTVKLWSANKQLLLRTYTGHSDEVADCQAKNDNSQIASCSRDNSVIIWDVATAKILRRFRNMAPNTCVCYGHESSVILAGSTDGTAKIYDLRAASSWEAIQCLDEASDCINCIRVYRHSILTASSDNCMREYDIRKGSLNIDRFDASLNFIELSKNFLYSMVSSLNGIVRMVDRETGQLLSEYRGHKNASYKTEIALAKNDSVIVSGSEDGKIYCWDVVSKDIKQVLKASPNPMSVVNSVSYSQSKDQLLTACGKNIKLWNLIES